MSSLQETAKETQTKDTIQTEGEKVTVEDNITQPSSTAQEEVTTAETQDLSHLPENVRILKEAFPDIDVEVIETILQIQGNSVDSAFELLLGMSDPNYKPTPPTVQEEVTPPMPPRPDSFISETRRSNSGEINAPYASWEGQQQQPVGPVSVEEQLRLDEEFAKKLAMEEESRNERRRMKQYQQKQQQQKQQKREADSDDDSLFNLQEELPIIKEKMIEAGNAAKKKMMDFYNQIKANTRHNNSNPNHQFDASSASTMPKTTNAQYRGLPSDDGDDLLTGDVSALHLSDYDVYAQTGGRQIRKSNDTKRGENNNNNSSSGQTSTSNAQLKSDEDFARQLYEEEQLEARKSSQENNNTPTLRPPQSTLLRKSTTPTVVIAPRSPLEFEGDSDYEGLSVTSSSNLNTTNNNKGKNGIDNTITEESSSVPYVIGDDDDSDSDDLVDIDEDELFDDDYEEEEDIKTNATKNKVIAVTEEQQDNKKEDTTTTNNNAITTTTTTTTTNNK